MDWYMEDKRDDIDEFIEIDDMRVANANLSDILERIKALSEKTSFCFTFQQKSLMKTRRTDDAV